ncbi:Proteasome-associated protein ECM29-like protein [Trichoplax sp. H2]|nr:Proteasome-associated protein ECM29-like protein [Trichoplax sp. H2]|eukprot:RDD46246.1 Proteasome-associated protein ECM29-like protein [Trichoplax sp. H2]
MTDVAANLELLERLLLRFGLAEKDEQLEKELHKFLPSILLKLSHPDEDVRKKVLELLNHVNKRIRNQTDIKLPLDALLDQFQDDATPSFVQNFTTVYLKMGFTRLSLADQLQIVPRLFECITSKTAAQQDRVFQLIVPLFSELKEKYSVEELRRMIGIADNKLSNTGSSLLQYLLDLLSMPYSPQIDLAKLEGAPCLSAASIKRIIPEGGINPDQLEKMKLGILKFLATDLFTETAIAPHLIIASGDARWSISNLGSNELTKRQSSIDWESAQLITILYQLYLGSSMKTLSKTQTIIKPEEQRIPANNRVKLLIIPLLIKSNKAGDEFPPCMQVIFDALNAPTTTQRLKTFALQFMGHVCKKSSNTKIKIMGPILFSSLKKLISSEKESILRQLSYHNCGYLSKRLPNMFAKDVGIVVQFFNALTEEDADSKSALRDALIDMASCYKSVSETDTTMLENLLLQYVEHTILPCRLLSVRLANIIFPTDNVTSRYVCILASADSNEEIREEAKRGLGLTSASNISDSNSTPDYKFPSFIKLLQYVRQQMETRLSTNNPRCFKTESGILPFSPAILMELLTYTRRCLLESQDDIPEDALQSIPFLELLDRHLQIYGSNQFNKESIIDEYFSLAYESLSPAGGSNLHKVGLYCLLEAINADPIRLHVRLMNGKWNSKIQAFVNGVSDDCRLFASRLYGMILASQDSVKYITQVRELLEKSNYHSFEVQHGSFASAGFCLVYRTFFTSDLNCKVVFDSQNENMLAKEILHHIAIRLADSQAVFVNTACTILTEMGSIKPLPLPDESDNDLSKSSIAKRLQTRLQKSKDKKVKENLYITIGHLPVGDPHFPKLKELIETMLTESKGQQIDLLFTIGKALSLITARHISSALQCNLISSKTIREPNQYDSELMRWLLDMLLTRYATNPNPTIRQATCIWLFSILKYSGNMPELQNWLQKIQIIFINFLTENDEITQEMASSGLGLLYDVGGSTTKDTLVNMLVDTLTSGRKAGAHVTSDTVVFKNNEVGETPEGSSMSTYKELCAVATDLNRPDLIYKFMHLANHNALWNSRKGAAIGFSSIASQARKELEPYLPKLIPRLFRYRYDPKIQKSMNSIWSALVPDTKIVDKYMVEIAKDLSKNLTNKFWRVRESSCLAVSDLLSGRSIDSIITYLPKLWESCLLVLDDIKETVRKAAAVSCQTLIKVTIKISSDLSSKASHEVVDSVLPILLSNKGIGSRAEEIRAISLNTVVEIGKKAAATLKPHIAVLIPTMIESLSSLEPQVMNYLYLQLRNKDSQELLDSHRVSASKSSPMMDTVKLCIDYIDEEILTELIPKLVPLIRHGIGVGTKAGCSHFVIQLVNLKTKELRPHAGNETHLNKIHLNDDRNLSISKAYASAIGHLVKIAKENTVSKQFTILKEGYFESGNTINKEGYLAFYNEEGENYCGLVLRAISEYASELFKNYRSEVMPLIFFAMHHNDSDSTLKSMWKELWIENTPGMEGGIRLYRDGILDISCKCISSQSWKTREKAAKSIMTLADKQNSELPLVSLTNTLEALQLALSGSVWDGKESVLHAITSLCKANINTLEEQKEDSKNATINAIIDKFVRECRRSNVSYKMIAMKSLTTLLKVFKINKFVEFKSIVIPYLEESESCNEGEKRKKEEGNIELKACIFECLGNAWHDSITSPDIMKEYIVLMSSSLVKNTWKVQMPILLAAENFLERACNNDTTDEMWETVLSNVLLPTLDCLDEKYIAVKICALKLLEQICKQLSVDRMKKLVKDENYQLLIVRLKALSTDSRTPLSERANQILKSL